MKSRIGGRSYPFEARRKFRVLSFSFIKHILSIRYTLYKQGQHYDNWRIPLIKRHARVVNRSPRWTLSIRSLWSMDGLVWDVVVLSTERTSFSSARIIASTDGADIHSNLIHTERFESRGVQGGSCRCGDFTACQRWISVVQFLTTNANKKASQNDAGSKYENIPAHGMTIGWYIAWRSQIE